MPAARRRIGIAAQMGRLAALAACAVPDAQPVVGVDFWPHAPFPKQREFLELVETEALYGGAAGGGKSDALLMAALQYAHVPGYAALILRRSYSDLVLPGAIMDRAREWLAPHELSGSVRWNEKEKTFRFRGGGRLQFGYLDNENDKFRYQSSEFQFIGFDELTQFPEGWYRYVLSRLRRSKLRNQSLSSVPLRVRSATNPGGIGHEWVRIRFVDADSRAPEVRFVPATLRDNPAIDFEEYSTALGRLDPTTREQLANGRWIRDSGGLVYERLNASCHINSTEGRQLTATILGLDFGFVDAVGFVIVGWEEHSRTVYVLESFKEAGLVPSQVAEKVAELEKHWRFDKIVGDVGGLGKGYAEEARRRFSLPIEPAEKNNKRGYIDLINGAAANGELKILRGSNAALIKELSELPWKKDRRDEEPGFDNHLCDALLYSWRACAAFSEYAKPKPKTKEELVEEERRALEDRAMRELEQQQRATAWWERQ